MRPPVTIPTWRSRALLPEAARRLSALGLRRGLSRALSIRRELTRVEVAGVPCWMDFRIPWERHVFLGFHDRELFEVYATWIGPGDVVVDVGANVGFHTALFASLVGESGQVLAVEPNPALHTRLERLIAENPRHNVTLLRCALSDHDGAVSLYVPEDNHTLSSVDRRQLEPNAHAVSVPCRRLDALLRQAKTESVRLLKLDVEGHEAQVLAGLGDMLRGHHIETIVLEVSPWRGPQAQAETVALYQLLTDAGYSVCGIGQRGLIPFDVARLDFRLIAPGYYLFATCVSQSPWDARGARTR